MGAAARGSPVPVVGFPPALFVDKELRDDLSRDERKALSELQETIVFGVARYWISILLCVGFGLMLGLYLAASKPNTYMSQAKLLLRLGERENITAEIIAGGSPTRESQPTMQDEIHLLTNLDVFKDVVEDYPEGPIALMKPADPMRYDGDGSNVSLHVRLMHELQAYLINSMNLEENMLQLPEHERVLAATEVLRQDTQVYNETGSNVISVLHSSTSPEKAQDVAVRLVKAFMERHRKQFSIDTEPMLATLTQERARSVQARAELDRFVEESGLLDFDLQLKEYLTASVELETELQAAELDVKALNAEIPPLENVKNKKPTSVEEQTAATQRLTELMGLIPAATVRRDQLQQDLAARKAQLDQLKRLEPRLRELAAAAGEAESAYKVMEANLQSALALAKLDLEGKTNLSVLQEPNLPIEKTGPKRLKLIVLGLGAGLAFGTTFAVLRQAFERRVRYPASVQRSTGLELLAVIPESAEVRRLQRVRSYI
jgi:uncharacterized protein involved in exopolysaccharide biosynthesis